ncbi:MAG: sensor histidine kinase [Roseburia hominis]
MSELCFLKNMVIQLSSARLCNQLNLMQVNIYSFMHQIDTSIRVLSWKNFVCNFQLEENLPLIELDPQLLKQAVINIIKNAFEAMHESGTTDIHVFYEEPWMSIAVIDHGGGLDPALADTIFQPFITSKTGGSGLGLVITRQIIESHHGTLTCDSRPGDGCTFTITLPLTQN